MMTDLFRALLSSFFGTLGFCVILQVPRRAVLPASAVGCLSYLLYWVLIQMGLSDAYAIFLAAVLGSLSAQFLARRMRMVASIYILMAIVATVPGLGLYHFMSRLGEGSYNAAAQSGTLAMILILGIALGVAAGSYLFRGLVRARTFLTGQQKKQ